MRKSLAVAAVFALGLTLTLAFSLPALADAGSWTGWITDAACGANGAKAEHKECALKCHREGQDLVFYNSGDKKIYKLSDQKAAVEHVGHEVTVTGTLEGDKITVASIAMHDAHAGHSH